MSTPRVNMAAPVCLETPALHIDATVGKAIIIISSMCLDMIIDFHFNSAFSLITSPSQLTAEPSLETQ